MDSKIKTAIDWHRAPTEAASEGKQANMIAQNRAHGIEAEVHDSIPVSARIESGFWVATCECGAGNGVHPEWERARCFACGAVHRVRLPRQWRAIEHVLLERPLSETRNWKPGETLAGLRAENREHGVTS